MTLSSRPDCACGHAYSAHHGSGPCLAAVSATGGALSRKAEGKVSAGSVCPCRKYAEKP